MEQRVLEHAPVAGGEDEAVAVEPGRVLRVEAEELIEQDVAQRRAPHGEARVARLRLLHGVHCQEPDRVHRLLHQLGRRRQGPGAQRGGRPAAGPGRGGEREAGVGGRAEEADAAAAGAGRRGGGGFGGRWCRHGCAPQRARMILGDSDARRGHV